jgi:uncharacterized membrane protein YcjF (UPF0283 family)
LWWKITEEDSMSLSSSESEEPMLDRPSLWENDTLHGALRGLVPLGLLVVVVAIAFALTAFIRQLVAGSGFFAQQQAAVITLIVGLVLAIVIYGVAIFFTLRRVASWQQTGVAARARAALWALGVTAFIVVLPVLLVIALPQHPAP